MSHTTDERTPCWIYRSSRKEEMYLYLATEDAFDQLPEALLKHFGKPVRVMELPLDPARKLAREDVNQVIRNLREQGFHLQLPPEIHPDLRDGEY